MYLGTGLIFTIPLGTKMYCSWHLLSSLQITVCWTLSIWSCKDCQEEDSSIWDWTLIFLFPWAFSHLVLLDKRCNWLAVTMKGVSPGRKLSMFFSCFFKELCWQWSMWRTMFKYQCKKAKKPSSVCPSKWLCISSSTFGSAVLKITWL